MAGSPSSDSFPYFDLDHSMELMMHQFAQPNSLDISNISTQSFIGSSSISNNTFFSQQPPNFPGNLSEDFNGFSQRDKKNVVLVPPQPILQNGNEFEDSKKRKLIDEPDNSCGNSSSVVSENGTGSKTKSKGKTVKVIENKDREVVHVRARRGQATDSHSLAERVRRGKINEKMRCLQDIVPGCYKAMGMAVMLDEIIHYVQSLQNQVEFLSLKLSAASSLYEFSTETHVMHREKGEGLQGGGGYEEINNMGTQIDFNFGAYPLFPFNT